MTLRQKKILVTAIAAAIAILFFLIFKPSGVVSAAVSDEVLEEAGAAENGFFNDVLENHPNFQAIKELRDLSVIRGYSNNTFRPEQTISRAEALTLILQITEPYRQHRAVIEAADIDSLFDDIPQNAWFRDFIEKGIALKLIHGYGDKTFRPLDPVRLQEALKMALAAFGLNAADIKEGPWYEKYFRFTEQNKLFDLGDDGKLSPHSNVTRSETAELLFRLKFFRENQKPYDYAIGWKPFLHDKNYFEISYPRDWLVFKGTKHSVIWKPDEKNRQVWMTRVTPLSARLSISLVEDGNMTSAARWFANTKNAQTSLYGPNIASSNLQSPITEKFIAFRETKIDGRHALFVEAPRKNIIDAYIFLENGKGLVFYGEYGDSPIAGFLKEQLETAIHTYRYITPLPPPEPEYTAEEKLEMAREAILIEERGPAILELLEDKVLIETDAIGVGTGPVDYYYSQEINATIKYERSSRTMLNIREGETSAF